MSESTRSKLHNHEVIINSAIAIIDLIFQKENLVQAAVYEKYGLLYQLEHGMLSNHMWFEGAFGYHFYGVDELPACSIVPTGNHIEMGSGNSTIRGSNERYLLFKHDCYGGEHDHYDRLDISYEAFGKRIAPDLGTTGYGALMHYDYYKNTGSHNTVNIDGMNQATANGVLTKCEETDGIVCLEAVADWMAPYQMPDSFTIVQWDEAAYRTVSMKRTILWAPEWFAEVFLVNGIPQGKTADWIMHFSGGIVSRPLGDSVFIFSKEKPYKHLHSMIKLATRTKKEGEGKTAQFQEAAESIQTIYQDGDVVTWVYGMENGQTIFVGKGPDNPSISDINYRIERADGPTAVFAHVIASAKGICPVKNVTFERDEKCVTIRVVQTDEKVIERKIEK